MHHNSTKIVDFHMKQRYRFCKCHWMDAGRKRDCYLHLSFISAWNQSEFASGPNSPLRLPQPDTTSGSHRETRAAQRQIYGLSERLQSEQHLWSSHLKVSGRGSHLDGGFQVSPRGSFFKLSLIKRVKMGNGQSPKVNLTTCMKMRMCKCVQPSCSRKVHLTVLGVTLHRTHTQAEVSFARNRKRRKKLVFYLQDKLSGIAPCAGTDFLIHTFTHGSWPASPWFTKFIVRLREQTDITERNKFWAAREVAIKVEPVSRLSFNKFHIFSQVFSLFLPYFHKWEETVFILCPCLLSLSCNDVHQVPLPPPPSKPAPSAELFDYLSDCLTRFDYRSLCNLSCSAADARLISSKVMNSLSFLNNNPNGRWEAATRNMSAWSYRTLKPSAAKSFEPSSSL